MCTALIITGCISGFILVTITGLASYLHYKLRKYHRWGYYFYSSVHCVHPILDWMIERYFNIRQRLLKY